MMRASEPPTKKRRPNRSRFLHAFDNILSSAIPFRISGRNDDTNSIDMKSILKVSIRQIKAARALLGWSQEDLAAMAGVSVPTVKRLEAADGLLGGREDTGTKLRGALERAGIEFTNGKHPGVRLRKPGRKT
jgi:ribosome-binding protein aMBF1 (putative translation factor)